MLFWTSYRHASILPGAQDYSSSPLICSLKAGSNQNHGFINFTANRISSFRLERLRELSIVTSLRSNISYFFFFPPVLRLWGHWRRWQFYVFILSFNCLHWFKNKPNRWMDENSREAVADGCCSAGGPVLGPSRGTNVEQTAPTVRVCIETPPVLHTPGDGCGSG